MSKFTRGKWEAQNWDSDRWAVFDETGITVADCFNNEANARLIAAAPEMYQWLGMLLCYVYEANALATNSAARKESAQEIAQVEALLARIDGSEARI